VIVGQNPLLLFIIPIIVAGPYPYSLLVIFPKRESINFPFIFLLLTSILTFKARAIPKGSWEIFCHDDPGEGSQSGWKVSWLPRGDSVQCSRGSGSAAATLGQNPGGLRPDVFLAQFS